MKNIGHFIKEERIRQNLKQSFLAKGICSISYLSKIENHDIQASDEVISLLLKKLNKDIDRIRILSHEEEKILKEELLEIYEVITINKNQIFAIEKIKSIEKKFSSILAGQNLIIYKNLVVLRLFLSLGDKENCEKYIDKILKSEYKLDEFQQYLFFKLKAIFFYQYQNKKMSLYYIEAIDKNYILSPIEEADFNYVSGLIYLVNNQIIDAIEKLNLSAEYFSKNFHMKRAVECYISIGIAYKKANLIQKSENNYLLAMKIVNELKLNEFKGIIYHNIGSLYSLKGDSKRAIDYYRKSIENKQDNSEKLVTVLYILKELIKHKSTETEQKYWIAFGEKICDTNKLFQCEYENHFSIFKELLENRLSEKTIKKSLNFFKEKQDYEHLSYYNNIFGEYFFNKGRYKIAANHYKNAYFYLGGNKFERVGNH
ncbi:helix-turn-helix domain-containing protein [Lysinibacillus halotolerans]|nr:helix-turn-helix domain-containing protein [Lysinibacillus halotolerans]